MRFWLFFFLLAGSVDSPIPVRSMLFVDYEHFRRTTIPQGHVDVGSPHLTMSLEKVSILKRRSLPICRKNGGMKYDIAKLVC